VNEPLALLTFPKTVDPILMVTPPVLARTAKLPAVPRFTGAVAITPGINTAAIRQITAWVKTIEKRFPIFFFVLVMVYTLRVIFYDGDTFPRLFHLLQFEEILREYLRDGG
jgi:hypothetical protein